MKFSNKFNRNVCLGLLIAFISQLGGTFALATQQASPISCDPQTSTEHKKSHGNLLESLIVEYIQQANSLSAEDAPS